MVGVSQVLVTTDQAPVLEDWLSQRHAAGLDRYDYWNQGVYVVVTGPSPEHGQVLTHLLLVLAPAAMAKGLAVSPPANIGIDKADCRVPDIAVYAPDTARTSPAFLATALLVVEVLSPGEPAQAKLDFYARWGVTEYLEADLTRHTVRLWHRTAGQPWTETTRSETLDLDLTAIDTAITWP